MHIKALFVDIGGVVLTNGWDHKARLKACSTFGLDPKELESRHALTFDVLEIGKISLDEYLARCIFYEKRPFTIEEFRTFMHQQSEPYDDMISLLEGVKERHNLKVAAVSNEGRELTVYRIEKFKLGRVFDFYVSSCFVHLRKPDPEIYTLALDLVQAAPQEVVYIDDRPMFVQVGASCGLQALQHTDILSTKAKLAALGLS